MYDLTHTRVNRARALIGFSSHLTPHLRSLLSTTSLHRITQQTSLHFASCEIRFAFTIKEDKASKYFKLSTSNNDLGLVI